MKLHSILTLLAAIAGAQQTIADCTDEEIKHDECYFRRRLATNEESWVSIKDPCNERAYKLSLYVNTHVYLIASPQENEANSQLQDCPHVVMDAKFGTGMSEGSKMVTVLADSELNELLGQRKVTLSQDFFEVSGDYMLPDLHFAVDNAKVKEDGIYNFFTNNCAIFVKSIGANLGITWNENEKAAFREYATGQLMSSKEAVRRMSSLRRLGVDMKSVVDRAVHSITSDLPEN
ncbi:unknown protein [Seminavis robusta]|uniref:Uncharacterized protein n=1 Tax=Seminavis robusta TaxID=568900 RepID=A0A9N8DBE3_9STRA|nr:unknown protein [Seminavis robusta]|eukprot:Sro64_g036500.1 n/a (233) ;mRNA; f:123797-124495